MKMNVVISFNDSDPCRNGVTFKDPHLNYGAAWYAASQVWTNKDEIIQIYARVAAE